MGKKVKAASARKPVPAKIEKISKNKKPVAVVTKETIDKVGVYIFLNYHPQSCRVILCRTAHFIKCFITGFGLKSINKVTF